LKSTTASTRADDGGEDADEGEGKRRAGDVAMAESEEGRLGRRRRRRRRRREKGPRV
jgi:hypothetical protein